MMIDIFTNAKKPFYSSTQFVALDKIACEKYHDFIKHLFEVNHRQIAPQAIDYILEWTKRHTYYTQSLCNLIYANGSLAVTVKEVKEACVQILQMNETIYLQYRGLLTSRQWNFMIAVAKEGAVSQITARAFYFSVITVTGPRQSGKTTLLQNIFSELPYFSLENLDIQNFAVNDPVAFLNQHPDGMILDEVHNAPGLLSYIQGIVDADPHRRFVLSGSSQFAMLRKVTQSLAGRTAVFELLPFSYSETKEFVA